MSLHTEESIRCTVGGCGCECFVPGRVQHRSCDYCGHGWVAHALDKFPLQAQCPSSSEPVEVARPGPVFDLSSLVLYGSQAVPVTLKILLDRLYSVLTPDQVADIIETLGWSLGDYIRGYMLQFDGTVLDHWVMMSAEEELLTLRQFLRFGETRPIVHRLATAYRLSAVPSSRPAPFRGGDTSAEQDPSPYPESCPPNVERHDDRPGVSPPSILRGEKNPPGNSGHFEKVPASGRGLSPPPPLPFHLPSAASHFLLDCLAPPTMDNTPPTKLSRLHPQTKTSEFNLSHEGRDEGHEAAGGRGNSKRVQVRRESSLLLSSLFPFNNRDSAVVKTAGSVRIKSDPDAAVSPSPAPSPSTHWLWRQSDDDVAKQETDLSSSSPPPPPPPSLRSYSRPPLSSSSFSCSSTPSKAFQKLHHPLPLSSYLPPSSFSLPLLSAGGRKGRVRCSVCGKSFYDKGTLKIHYNAVHLKIKHRCTVKGCNMVFSSLRSRNRHSANPNPRLHTHTNTTDVHSHTDTNAQTIPPLQHAHIYAHANLRLRDEDAIIRNYDALSRLLPSHVQRDAQAHRQSSRNARAVPRKLAHATVDADTLHTEETCLRDGQTRTRSNATDVEQRSADVDMHRHMRTTQKTGRAEAHTHTNSATTVPHNGRLSPERYTEDTDPVSLYPDPHPSQPLPPSHGASSLASASPVFPLTPRLAVGGPRQTESQQHPVGLRPAQNTSPPPLPAGAFPAVTMGTASQSATSDPEAAAPQFINQQSLRGPGEPVPKKKPRKSSMPVKIEQGERTDDRGETKL